jgi:hypothetical protein
MKLLQSGLSALVVWSAAVLPASAAWDNVFQPTLFCRQQPSTTARYYAPPAVVYSSPVVAYAAPVVATPVCDTCAQAPPQQQCNTSYTQRCYYQPVTTYQTKTYYEPVTSYRTSYYYEPVTSYSYSAYYDPCSCGYQQVAVPSVSYMLRAQNCPVQSWVQRCVQEPVTSYTKACYWQPQTTCCSTTQGAPIAVAPTVPTAPPVIQGAPSAPVQPVPQQQEPPSISGTRTQPMAAPRSTMWDATYPTLEKTQAPGAPYQPQLGAPYQPQLGAPVPAQNSPAPPPVKLDRITVGPNSHVDGQVVRADNSPRPNAKVMFINASTGQRQTIYANTAGRFQVDLAAGSWHVYLHGADDIPMHNSRIDVNGSQTRQVSLVSRGN